MDSKCSWHSLSFSVGLPLFFLVCPQLTLTGLLAGLHTVVSVANCTGSGVWFGYSFCKGVTKLLRAGQFYYSLFTSFILQPISSSYDIPDLIALDMDHFAVDCLGCVLVFWFTVDQDVGHPRWAGLQRGHCLWSICNYDTNCIRFSVYIVSGTVDFKFFNHCSHRWIY